MRAALILLFIATPVLAADNAREIADTADKRHRVAYEHTHARMTLQEKDGASRERTLESWYANDEKNGDKLKIRFQTPADVQGTGLLSLEVVGAESDDEQWLYLPAFKKTRRIAQAELGDRFVGTDFFYEDMKRRRLDDYTYTLLPAESIEGQECWVIEAIPSAPKVVKQSPYGKTMLWVRKDNYFVVRARVFDKKLAPLKQIDSSGLKQVNKLAWRADQTTVVDVTRKHRTVMTVIDREVKTTADDVFTRRLLESE